MPPALGKYAIKMGAYSCFQQDGGYCNSKVGLGSVLGLSPATQSPNGIENAVWDWKNVKTLRHSQQQPQGPKTHKKKSTIRLTIRTMF